jgi:1,4-alpha-glucan branching enzyme
VLTSDDLHLFNEGRHIRLYDRSDSTPVNDGVYFATWAPDALTGSVFGEFNDWQKFEHQLTPIADSGIWEGVVPGVVHGDAYKYHVLPRSGGEGVDKADPFATYRETPPETASRVWELDYNWADDEWMYSRDGAPGTMRQSRSTRCISDRGNGIRTTRTGR